MDTIPLAEDTRPLALSACLRAVGSRVLGRIHPPQRINWKDTIAEMCARALVGLLVGSTSCVLLVPVLFWPGRGGRPSLYDQWGGPDWIVWVFVALLAGAILFRILTTRATVRDSGIGQLPDHFYDL